MAAFGRLFASKLTARSRAGSGLVCGRRVITIFYGGLRLHLCIHAEGGITEIYCVHYPYVNKAFDKAYVVSMRELAEAHRQRAGEGKVAQ